jgi:hypothetical protein
MSAQDKTQIAPDISLAFAAAFGDSADCNLVVDRRSAVRTGPPPVAPKRAAPVTNKENRGCDPRSCLGSANDHVVAKVERAAMPCVWQSPPAPGSRQHFAVRRPPKRCSIA